MHVGHQRTDTRDGARELVPNDERRMTPPARPLIPFVNVNVRAAHTRAPHADQHLVVPDRRLCDVLQPEAWGGGLFHKRFHAIYSSNQWSDSVGTTIGAQRGARESCRCTADDARGTPPGSVALRTPYRSV